MLCERLECYRPPIRLRIGLMRILRDSPRPRLRNRHDLRGSLLAALRAPNLGQTQPADSLRQFARVDLASGAALARDAHFEKSKAVGQPLDVSEHAHGLDGAQRRASASMQCSGG